MKLTPLASNMTEVKIGNKRVLFSYQTPVATKELTGSGMTYYKTNKFWSATTTRHINKWLPKPQNEFGVTEENQEYFDNLLNEVK